MKQHRWVHVVTAPCKIQKNEDNEFTLSAPFIGREEVEKFPRYVICVDCREAPFDVWGTPCLADENQHMATELWDGV